MSAPPVHQAHHTDLKSAIGICLDEALAALEETLTGLTDEQAWAYPVDGKHNIATIVMHIQENLDVYGNYAQTGEHKLEHDPRFDMWGIGEGDVPWPTGPYPTVETMLERTRKLRETVLPTLEAATVVDMGKARGDVEWFARFDRVRADAYMRTAMHTMAHVRQIWFMRGIVGLTDKQGWPQQHWA